MAIPTIIPFNLKTSPFRAVVELFKSAEKDADKIFFKKNSNYSFLISKGKVNEMVKAMIEQDAISTDYLNYGTFMKDIHAIIRPEIQAAIRKDKNYEQAFTMLQEQNRIFLNAFCIEQKQNGNKRDNVEMHLAYLVLLQKTLRAFKEIYGISLLDKQDEFVKNLSSQIKENQRQLRCFARKLTGSDVLYKVRNTGEKGMSDDDKPVYFKSNFTLNQKKDLRQWLLSKHITDSPELVLEFWSGKNQEYRIKKEGLQRFAVLLHKLCNEPKLLEINATKGYFAHSEKYIYRYSEISKGTPLKDIKRAAVDKRNKNHKFSEEVNQFLTRLNSK